MSNLSENSCYGYVSSFATGEVVFIMEIETLLEEITTQKIGTITLSMCINFIAIILSVMGVLTPTTGALVHNAGSCFVVLPAALLYDRKYKG